MTRRAFDEATLGSAAVGTKAISIARFRIDLLGCGASAKGAPSGLCTLGLGDNPLSFQAAHVATRTTVIPEPANVTAQFTVVYK